MVTPSGKLNQEQLSAVKYGHGPILVVAGAGTGKTQVITQRVAHLIKRLKVLPHNILAITFTEKAAREMETRVSDLLGRYVTDVNITTFNAYGDNLLKRFSYEIGLNPNLKLMNEIQQLVFLKENIDQLDLDYYAPVSNPEGMLEYLVKYFSLLKNELIEPSNYLNYVTTLERLAKTQSQELEVARQRELARAYQKYQQLTAALALIDYDDQIYLTVKLLEQRPNLRQKLHRNIKYLLVDEFQDTNKAQNRLIDLLIGGRKNIMAVGDDDQSIYRFRGAALSNILEFKQRYKSASQTTLIQNYRSTQAILDSAHQLIQYNNPDRLEAKYGLDKRLVGRSHGKEPIFKSFLRLEEEAQWVARDIARRLKAGQTPAEVAILTRTNSQAQALTKYLEGAGIDFIIMGQSLNLYQQPEIRLILNYLRVLVDPDDNVNLYHLLTSPVYGLSVTGLQPLVAQTRRQRLSLETFLREETLASNLKSFQEGFFAQLDQWREQMASSTVGQMCFNFLQTTGYLKKLINQARNEPALDQTIVNLNQFFSTLREFEQITQDTSVTGYINNLPALLGRGERLALEDIPDLQGQKIRLLTVHKAKGLEFDVVYLFDMTQGHFPMRNQSPGLEVPPELLVGSRVQTDSNTQEERRLMYVAITRAKRELILTASIDHGGKRAQKISQFITEMLGEYPLKANLGNAASTDQIMLFKPPRQAPAPKSALPPNLLQGVNLVLTAHQIEDYLMCPAEFKLRHIISPPQPLIFALEYGTLMHSLIQLYNQRLLDGNPLSSAEMQLYLDSVWPQESFISAGHKRRSLSQARSTLDRFHAREQELKRHPKFIELSFSFELSAAKAIVKGRFDAVYEDAEGVEIRDYKTGTQAITNQEKADKKAAASLQLGIYTLAWQSRTKVPPTLVSLDFIDAGFIGKAKKSSRQLETIERKIVRVVEGVRAGDFEPGRSHLFCTHPEYGF